MKGKRPDYNFDIIKELIKQGKTTKDISKIYNINKSSLSRVLKKENIYFKGQRFIKTNHDFFENIDSEIKAYLLGFFVADGCVYDNSRFGLCIAEQDEYIVNLFAKYISPLSFIKKTHNIKGALNRQPQLFLRISSKKIVNDLKKLGIENRKTYKPIHIPNIPNNLKLSFIRGYFDGDGHFRMTYITKYKSCRVTLTNGDRTILDDIQKFFNFGKVRNYGNYYTYNIDNKKESLLFMNSIYKDCNFMLPRKFNKFILINTELNSEITKGSESV